MDGVVTLLPEPIYTQVEEIWSELAQACGVQGINATPVPHFSWHVAERYHEDLLQKTLQELANRSQPFQVRTAGLGVFSRQLPIRPTDCAQFRSVWFSRRLLWPSPWIAEKCANKSLPPPSGVMKPKPLPSSNHLTVPVSVPLVLIEFPLNERSAQQMLARGRDTQESIKGNSKESLSRNRTGD